MENKQPIITVVVPIYNMAQYVERAVHYLLEQEYTSYEIILVDDGSTDGSSDICDKLAAKNERIFVVHKENGGLSSARNAGIENAHGKFIIFPDPDDWTEPNYLGVLIDLREKYHADLEIGGHYVADEEKEYVHNAKGQKICLSVDEALVKLMSSNAYCGFAWNKLYHLDIIQKNGLRFDTELGMAQDLHFAVKYFLCCEKIAYNPTPTYHYFQHAGGVTNTAMPLTKRKISGLQTYLKIAEITQEKQPQIAEMAYATLCNLCVHFMYIYYNSKMKSPETLALLREYVKQYKKYFFKSKAYGKAHRLLFRMAVVSPKLYYRIKKLAR